MMLIFALFTLGYFCGVVTALAIFPPRTKEIAEQEKDAALPVSELGGANCKDYPFPAVSPDSGLVG